MKGWDYSILTKNANIHGGPEKYINKLKEEAYRAAIKATDKSYQIAMKTSDKKWFKRTLPLAPFAVIGFATVSLKVAKKIKRSS